MKKIALVSIWIAILGVSQCVAQSNNSQIAANWGQSVQGVQLMITMTNRVFQIGSSSVVTSVTRNSSTNAITIDVSAPTVEFDVLLKSETGKLYHITTPLKIRELSKPVMINPGEEKSESIPVTFGVTRFGDAVEPGDYMLKATRPFVLNDKEYTVESNSIKVKIVK
ncbi:MAG TPA: hypothetical protein VIK53_16985 [Verrucomicrobiae bacterium]